jgi:hypothetical protein
LSELKSFFTFTGSKKSGTDILTKMLKAGRCAVLSEILMLKTVSGSVEVEVMCG